MTVIRYTVEVQNSVVGTSNPCYVGFTFDNANTAAQNAAAAILYVASAAPQMMAANSYINGVSERIAGSAGSSPVPFPTAAFAALQTALAGPNVSATAMTAYGAALGGGALTPIGTSVCVAEQTATVGRTGQGRHYLPFVTALAVDAAGAFTGANATNVALSYAAIFFTGGFNAVVCPQNLTSPKPVTIVVARGTLSNLETRRR